jgi:hypothetical protein
MSSPILIRPAGTRFAAWYQDGVFPLRHIGCVELEEHSLRVIREGADDLIWDYPVLRLASSPHHGEPVRLTPFNSSEAVVIEDPLFLDAWRQRFPVHTSWYEITPEWERWPAVTVAMIAIGAIAALLYFHGLPWASDAGARAAPRWIEERLGKAVTNILAPASGHCSDPQSLPLLDRIPVRLFAALPKDVADRYQFRVIYSRGEIHNAFAAPAGHVVVFRGLLNEMESPEELAGVLAHEFQHVAFRHSMRALAREVSGRTLLSLLSFDSSGTAYGFSTAASLVNLHYQRGDEQQADDEGVALLARASIRPDSLALLLRRLRARGMLPELSSYLATHPASVERAERLEQTAARYAGTYKPLMTDTEWRTARAVCDGR